MTKIHLIATNLRSPSHIVRLYEKLKKLEPSLITINESPQSIDYFRNNKEKVVKILSHPYYESDLGDDDIEFLVEDIKNKLEKYEIQALDRYTKLMKIPYLLIGNQRDFDQLIKEYARITRKSFFSGPKIDNLAEIVTYKKHKINQMFQKGIPRIEEDRISEVLLEYTRDTELNNGLDADYMYKFIRNLINNQNKVLVHLDSELQLLDDPNNQTIYSKLKHLNPTREYIY